MVLNEVEINNFKSIEHCIIDVQKGCRIFVGLNGTGKSNILLALSSLDNNLKLSGEFVKEGTRSTLESSIEFMFSMDSNEKLEFIGEIEKNIFSTSKNKFIKLCQKNLKMEDFLKYEYTHYVDVRKNTHINRYYELDDLEKYEISDNHIFIIGSDDNPVIIKNKKTLEEISINKQVVVNKDEFDFETNNIKKIIPQELNTYFCSFGLNIVKKGLPSVLFWEYKDEYLLPSSIIINDFISDPNINIPLKYIFELSDIYDIKAEYDECIARGESSFQNLLNSVSRTINKYLKTIWKSMPKNCEIEMKQSADKINIRIKDATNSYLLNSQSDGFKRLITYMIMLSVKNKNNNLNNTLLLIDEPEIKIDIPGQEYLKLELINISKNNYIFYSTHSTSMIDTTNIGRHFIVNKDNECTKIDVASEENYDSALALYKALGMQVYAIINDKNLIFEGWTDMNIFKVALNKLTITKKNKFKNVGITHVSGSTKFRDFASFWGLLAKEYYILSDADTVSSNQKEVFLSDGYSGTWLKYDEFDLNYPIYTCEDFIETFYILNQAKKYGNDLNFSVEINIDKLNDSSISNVKVIEEWIKYNELDGKKAKVLINNFKVQLSTNIKKENIKDEYKCLLDKLIEIMDL